MPNAREKLIELLKTVQHSGVVYQQSQMDDRKYNAKQIHNIDVADHLIANGVTVQEWISVTERLPERVVFTYADSCEPSGFGEYLKSGWVLVYTKSGSVTAGFLCDNYWDTDNGDDEVTHWMPLPEPPTEK